MCCRVKTEQSVSEFTEPPILGCRGTGNFARRISRTIFNCYRHPETMSRVMCRKPSRTCLQAQNSSPWTTQVLLQNSVPLLPRIWVTSNQRQTHNTSHNMISSKPPNDTVIPAHHFCSTLVGSMNNACTCTHTHSRTCTPRAALHSGSVLPALSASCFTFT